MIAKLSAWLQRVSSGRVALSALVLFLLFTGLVLPGQAAQARAVSGAAGSPDMSFFYTAADLDRMAEAYGPAGRQAYVQARFTFDLVWPVVYALLLVTGISWVFQRTFAPGTLWQRANLAPLLGLLFDYLENISTSWVMLRYPAPAPVVAALATGFTLTKWVFIYGSFGLLLIGLMAGAARWIGARRPR